jgi:hypothetical protein
MAVPLLQKTCCNAAHSGSAQVTTTASAAGRLDGVFSSCGAECPIASQFTAGNAGVLLMDGWNFLAKSAALTAAETRSRAGCNASLVPSTFAIGVICLSPRGLLLGSDATFSSRT